MVPEDYPDVPDLLNRYNTLLEANKSLAEKQTQREALTEREQVLLLLLLRLLPFWCYCCCRFRWCCCCCSCCSAAAAAAPAGWRFVSLLTLPRHGITTSRRSGRMRSWVSITRLRGCRSDKKWRKALRCSCRARYVHDPDVFSSGSSNIATATLFELQQPHKQASPEGIRTAVCNAVTGGLVLAHEQR